MTIPVYESRGCLWSAARDSRIAIRGVAHQRQVVRDVRRRNAVLGADSVRIANLAASAIHLDHALSHNTLREIFVRRPDAHLLHLLILGRKVGRRSERVISLE